MAEKLSGKHYRLTAVCRRCSLEQLAGGWGRTSGPRCRACGGLLDRKYVRRKGTCVVSVNVAEKGGS